MGLAVWHFMSEIALRVQAASSERISDSQRQQLVNRIETAGVPSGAELRNGKPSNGVVISSTALADSVDYSQQASLFH